MELQCSDIGTEAQRKNVRLKLILALSGPDFERLLRPFEKLNDRKKPFLLNVVLLEELLLRLGLRNNCMHIMSTNVENNCTTFEFVTIL